MADQTPNIFPAMRFADADAAVDWLSQAFGFTERSVHRDEEEVIRHAEMSLGAGTVMYGHGEPRSHSVYVAVDDADAHHARARAACASSHSAQAAATPRIAAINTVVRALAGGARPGSGTT
jgi:uncharacterized glyoxalase superfamily protein PhnB